MNDQFKNDLERIQKLVVSIKSDMNKRDQKKKAGQQTTMLEGEIRGQLTSLGIQSYNKDRELVLIADLIKYQENTQLQKETEKRKNQIQELKNQRDLIKEQFDKSVADSKQEMQNMPRNDAQLQGMSNQELHKNQKDLQLYQDQLLDQTQEQVVVLKHQGKNINQTLDQQNRQLDQLNEDVDKTNKQMMTTNSKIAKLIATSSNLCLFIVIGVEIALIPVFIFTLS